jgi:hypothetical protein
MSVNSYHAILPCDKAPSAPNGCGIYLWESLNATRCGG